MTVRSILRLGDPLLRLVAEPVEDLGTPELRELVADMLETMQAAHGAGIAAPQIGASKRVLVFGVESTPRYPDAEPIPQTILINPSFEVTDQHEYDHLDGVLFPDRVEHAHLIGFEPELAAAGKLRQK